MATQGLNPVYAHLPSPYCSTPKQQQTLTTPAATDPDKPANQTNWQCTIVETSTADGHETDCSFSVPNSDPVASFYGIPCSGGKSGPGFAVSWGYNKEVDSAVVSVCL